MTLFPYPTLFRSSEEVVLNSVTHKPSDGSVDSFTSGPHGLEKLRGFLEHLNSFF
jgi:hypothetical protein